MSIVLPPIGGGSLVRKKSRVSRGQDMMIISRTLDFSSEDDEGDHHHSKEPSKKIEEHIESLRSIITEASENIRSRQSTFSKDTFPALHSSMYLGSFKFSLAAVSTPEQDKIKVKESLRYEKKRRIGWGASGTVWLSTYQNEEVAVKEVYLDLGDDCYEYRMKKIMEEFDAHKKLNHPNIIKFYDGELNQDMIVFITEYMKNGSLAKYVKDHGPLAESMVRQTVYQVIRGLAYIHSNGIIHRDIKGANILIADDSQLVKITDFGVSVSKIDSSCFTNSKCFNGSHHWMAPEFFSQDHYDARVDTWSVGCLAIELMTGRVPFINQAKDVFSLNNMFQKMESGYFPIAEIFTTVESQSYRSHSESNDHRIRISKTMMLFFQKVFQWNPKKRHTCSEILENLEQYPWLNDELLDDPSIDLMMTKRN